MTVNRRRMSLDAFNSFLRQHSVGKAEFEINAWKVPIDSDSGKSLQQGYIYVDNGTEIAICKSRIFDDWYAIVPEKPGDNSRVIFC